MKNIAITIHSLRKVYRLFESREDRVKEALNPFGKKFHRDFWALDGLDFKVPQGQTLGIIGRNGSGKSTLLQHIAGIIQPTEGEVRVNGRLSAILELGAGFNPEFSGRDNVMLNAAIMGVDANELSDRLSEIEAFADIGQFFDQPIKNYSSGMLVRLAFSAATNMEPDILIIDEALAVGDVRFQHKCYERFKDLQRNKTTILFVSHSQDAIANICERCILLEKGRILADGEPADVLPRYHELMFTGRISEGKTEIAATNGQEEQKQFQPTTAVTGQPSINNSRIEEFVNRHPTEDQCHLHLNYNPDEYRFGDRRAIIIDYGVFTEIGMNTLEVQYGENIDLVFSVLVNVPISQPMVGYSIKRVDGVTLAGTNTRLMNQPLKPFTVPGQILSFHFRIQMCLAPTDLFIEIGVAEWLKDVDAPADIRKNVIQMKVMSTERLEGIAGLTRNFQDLRSPQKQDPDI